jgi:hypothetical protein
VRPFRIRSRNLSGEPTPPRESYTSEIPAPVSYITRPETPLPRSLEVGASEAHASPAATAAAALRNAPLRLTPRPNLPPLRPEVIAARAYEIWERRGRRDGEHEQNWFAACEELEQERTNGAYVPAPRR